MADGSVRANQSQKTQPAFFGINGKYVVAEGAEASDLLDDVACLAECAEAALQAIIDGMSSDGSQMRANPNDAVKLAFGVMYNVQMMANLAHAANILQPASGEVGHG